MAWHSWQSDEYEISTDPARIDIGIVHWFLTNCYWAQGIPEEVVRKSIENSICFGLYKKGLQAGFARVITDRATFAYIADVFILLPYRGHLLSPWLMDCIMDHPELQGLRRWALVTVDAHGLYELVGFERVKNPERWMEKHDPDVYKAKAT